MKYVAFDLEIAAEIPEGATDWKAYRPLGITCAATLPSDGEPSLWFGNGNGLDLAPRMTQEDVCNLVDYLCGAVADGYRILTWNGLSFDFDVLAEESGLHAECAELALNHIDMMYHVFCIRGHYLGLDKVAKGLGLPGKLEGVSGAKAPAMWANGEQDKVLEYVAQDVVTTLQVAEGVDKLGAVVWTSNTGRGNIIDIDRWLTVTEAQALPLPDTSWMREPVSREKFTAWIDGISQRG
jgi:hypothetical protein